MQLIDSDPYACYLSIGALANTNPYSHVKRVFGYARPWDYAVAGGLGTLSPISFWLMERVHPSHAGKGAFAPMMRLATAIGVIGGVHILYQRSCSTSMAPYTAPGPTLTWFRPLLRVYGERSRSRDGYEGDG